MMPWKGILGLRGMKKAHNNFSQMYHLQYNYNCYQIMPKQQTIFSHSLHYVLNLRMCKRNNLPSDLQRRDLKKYGP